MTGMGINSPKRQFSLATALAVVTLFGLGLALTQSAPLLSRFSLIAVFVIACSAGIMFGRAKSRWWGSFALAFTFGAVLIVVFVALADALIDAFGRR